MTLTQFGGLVLVYFFSVLFILFLTYREFLRVRFNFNIFFSLLFLLTFYFGFPLSCILVFQFETAIVPVDNLLYALLASTAFYAIYYVSYKTRLTSQRQSQVTWLTVTRLEAKLTGFFLALLSITMVVIFFIHNGFLLFKLQSYSHIFSREVSAVSLKRFFYFFIPAMLVYYFLKENVQAWWLFLAMTVAFGMLTYIIVGGTRANIIIAFALFLFIGIVRGWIKLWMLALAGSFGIVGMFWLALKRYNLDVNGAEAFYTFLYLTRDTFSPWENFGLLLSHYSNLDFQGLMPIVRDFYVFIPEWIWPNRPNQVLNAANYFTWNVLNNHSGLAISPTLIGSLVVMGGIAFVPIGAVIVGFIIKWFDWLYQKGQSTSNRYRAAIIQAFCFGAVFNLIVLVREGMDAFVSRLVFFCLVFGLCLLVAKLFCWLLNSAGLIKQSVSTLKQVNSDSSD